MYNPIRHVIDYFKSYKTETEDNWIIMDKGNTGMNQPRNHSIAEISDIINKAAEHHKKHSKSKDTVILTDNLAICKGNKYSD